MTLDKFLSTPNAAIILESKEDFKFLQKEFCKRNINWCNNKPFSAPAPYLERDFGYPVYITSNISWGYCTDVTFKKITTIIDLDSIDDFYDERITIEEFVNSKEELVIHVKNNQEALTLLDRLQLLDKTYADGTSYLTKEEKFKDLSHCYAGECCYTNQGCYGSKSFFKNNGIKVYEFEDINFDITFTDFFKKPKEFSYYYEDVRAVNLRTEDEMNKFMSAMKSKKITPPTDNGFNQYGNELCFTNLGTYGDIGCYYDQKEVNGASNITFAPIYTFDEIIFD